MAFASLTNQQFMNLVTVRKSGVEISTPVWFAQSGDRLYVMTGRTAGKIKRIRNNSQVYVAPADRAGNALGERQPAHAAIVSDPAEEASAIALLNAKYGMMKRMFDLMAWISGGLNNRAYIVITPTV